MKINWQIKKLGEVCNVFTDGNWIEKKDQSPEGIRLVQTGNIGNGVFKDREEKARYISEKTFKQLRCTEILPFDCLISRLPDPVGRSCIIPDAKEKMITAVDCTIIRFKKETILAQWFVYYSLSQEYQNQINKHVSGATRQRISRSNLGLIDIPLSSLLEQQRIVEILDKVFEEVTKAKENTERNLQNARELFKSYLQNVFANPGDKWEKIKLGKVIKLAYGKPLQNSKRKSNGTYPVYGANGIKDRTDEYYYDKQSIIIGRKGSAGEINLTEKKFWPLDVTYYIEFDNNKYSLNFLYYLLSSLNLSRLAKGVKPGINRNEIYSIVVQIPSFTEQKAIVAKLDILSEETKKLENIYKQKLANLDEIKKSILKKAFSGEL
ncbi:MAG: restriction endonuclease subunit S [Candidatus Humimicrobiaceae bacterium]